MVQMHGFIAISLLALTLGCGSVVPTPAADAGVCGAALVDDELACKFDQGTFVDTEWAGNHIQLEPGRTNGSYTSRVFDLGESDSGWASLAWTARAPYGKPLPDNASSERAYTEGGIDMTGNVLLLHLDQDELGNGRQVVDASGRDNHAVMVTSGEIVRRVPGRFQGALDDTASTYTYVDVGTAADLDFGTEDFTWALWARSTEDCSGNKVYLGIEDAGADRTHLWLGCAASTNSNCPDGPAGGRAAGTFRSDHGAADGSGFCGVSRIDDGAWHHLALVKQGHPDSFLRLYVDGVLEFESSATFVAPLSFLDAPELAVGAFSRGTYQASGAFDEVAVWRRALGSGEISALYRRGALRLSFQVRTCDDADCSGTSRFVGPAADTAAFFVEPPATLEPGAPVPIGDDVRGRHLQYRAYFESDIANLSPALEAVVLAPSP